MAPAGLEVFNQDGSTVEIIGAEHSPGMEINNGTLYVGLLTAAGLAFGRKRKGETGDLYPHIMALMALTAHYNKILSWLTKLVMGLGQEIMALLLIDGKHRHYHQ